MTTTGTGALDGSEDDQTQSELWSKIPVTPHRKEALLRALSNLDLMARKATPEVAQEVVSRHFEHYMENAPPPPLIAGFLDRHWRFYMATLYVLEGELSEPWRSALESTECLIWSVQPKCDEQSRQQLYERLPGLLQWVHTLLDARHVDEPDEDLFFARLARLHAAALNPDAHVVAGSAPSAPFGPAAPNRSAALSRDDADAAADSAEAVDSPRSEPIVGQAVNTESDLLRDLVVGVWVEFQSPRETKRVMRLEWISRRGGVYLFRDENRGDALCLTAHRCAQCLREHSASVLH